MGTFGRVRESFLGAESKCIVADRSRDFRIRNLLNVYMVRDLVAHHTKKAYVWLEGGPYVSYHARPNPADLFVSYELLSI